MGVDSSQTIHLDKATVASLSLGLAVETEQGVCAVPWQVGMEEESTVFRPWPQTRHYI